MLLKYIQIHNQNLCINAICTEKYFALFIHSHIYIYNIYICVCVCVCVSKEGVCYKITFTHFIISCWKIIVITVTSRWARLGLKSPASRLFTQSFIQTQIKEYIKAPRHWPLCGEFTGDRWIARTNGQLRGKCFHLMTSSWCRFVYIVRLFYCSFHCSLSFIYEKVFDIVLSLKL